MPHGQTASGEDNLGNKNQINNTMLPQLSVNEVKQLGLLLVPAN